MDKIEKLFEAFEIAPQWGNVEVPANTNNEEEGSKDKPSAQEESADGTEKPSSS